jgi:hypothetical protein
MISIKTIATFFGWCTFINFGILLFFLLFMGLGGHEFAGEMSAKLFGITQEQAKSTFFRVFQQYRLAIAFLNLVPYIALKIMIQTRVGNRSVNL